MKQIITLLFLCTLFACKQPASDAKQPTAPAKPDMGKDDNRPLSMVSSIMIEDGGAVVPDPLKKRYTFRNSHPEGDLHQVFFDYNESNNTKSFYDGTFAIRMDDNQKAYELLEKASAITEIKTPDGPPCVGSRGSTITMLYFDGKKTTLQVPPCMGDKLPAALRDLNALAASLTQDLKAEISMRIYKIIDGKTWVSKSDPKTPVTFVDGHMNETIKGVDNPPSFFRLSDNCKGAKDRKEGMSAGNLGCLISWAQDEVQYMITDIDNKTLEFKQMGTEKLQTYTLAKGTPTPAANGIVINAKGDDFFFGKKFEIRNLPALLDEKLAKMDKIPDDIPVTFNGETGMGIRGEVRTEIKEAIAKAKIYQVLMSDKGEDMVKNFYAWYMGKLNESEGYSLIKNKNDAESLLTPDLYKYLVKEDKKEGGLGFDYFLRAQDFGKDWGTVTILNTKTDGSKRICTTQLGTGADKMRAQKIIVTVVDKKAGWRIEKVEEAK